jgi:hypothetical protein
MMKLEFEGDDAKARAISARRATQYEQDDYFEQNASTDAHRLLRGQPRPIPTRSRKPG